MTENTSNTKTETPEERARLLSELSPREREIVEDILRDHPSLTAAECIEHARAMGL
jgi:FixJ family two-component response regulator